MKGWLSILFLVLFVTCAVEPQKSVDITAGSQGIEGEASGEIEIESLHIEFDAETIDIILDGKKINLAKWMREIENRPIDIPKRLGFEPYMPDEQPFFYVKDGWWIDPETGQRIPHAE